MRLEKIKLSGFKSFVDPTSIEFPSNLVGVIGPNGCGKSNIIDAIRWVLGESSAKMLRGESMTDVIFNGSSERKPVGLASVELVFDNSDGKVGGEYAAYSQISIRREVNREAQSNYFLNNTRCRRKDIFNAFYGTGLGARSYSVIEQGMISRFIEAKPEELRIYLEEVAGISKYKARRKETETRINHTRENLARLTDIRDELEKQLNTLSRQAEAAERYKTLKAEEHVLKAQLNVLHWRQIDVKNNELEAVLQERANQQESKKANLQKIETEIEETRQQQIHLTDAFQESQQKYYAIGSEVTRIEQAIAHQKERKQKLLDDQEQLENDYQSTQDHLADNKDQVGELQEEIERLTPALESSQERLALSEDVLSSAEADMQSWQEQWDVFNQRASVVVQAVNVEKTKINHLQSKIQGLRDQLIRYETQLDQIDLLSLTKRISELEEKLQVTVREQIQSQQSLQVLTDTLKEKYSKEELLKTELEQAYEKQRHLSSRYATLTALQQASLGQTNERVQHWLESRNLGDNPRLLQTLDVENGWEKAVETVLGDYIEAICVEDVSQLVHGFVELAEGNILLLEKDSSASVAAQADTLATKVSSEWPVQRQLASVKIAADLAQALQRRKTLQEHESIITAEGIWLGKNWLRVSRSHKTEGNVIERKKELEKLEAELKTLSETIQVYQSDLKHVKSEIQTLLVDQRHLQEKNMSLSVNVAEHQSFLKSDQQKREEDQLKQQQLKQDLERANDLIETSEQELSLAQQTYEEAVLSQQTDESSRIELSSKRETLRQAVIVRKQELAGVSQEFHEHQIRLQTCKSQFETINQNIERLESRLSDLLERREQLNLAIHSSENPSKNLEEELKLKLMAHSDSENKLKQLRLQVESITERMNCLEQARVSEEAFVSAARDAIEQVKLDMQTFKVRSQTIIEQIQAMEFSLDELNQALADDATVEAWQENLSKVENRIVRLGAINLAAAEEYKVQLERKSYLDSQNEDLSKALEILEDAIRKIDKETKTRFKETFETVNATFQELFPQVFGGGSAYLELLDEDLLNTGVAVFARPPGKKNTTIHLLSGGEKALTAVALVFAIFKLNPAPFCLLDEVDAPLDDVNLLRYCGLVREMSKTVQFIFVTHNKIAMEMAEQLMGVTMHEPGVSRIVTVDVQQAVEMAEA